MKNLISKNSLRADIVSTYGEGPKSVERPRAHACVYMCLFIHFDPQ